MQKEKNPGDKEIRLYHNVILFEATVAIDAE
jgi:hypothetical protein